MRATFVLLFLSLAAVTADSHHPQQLKSAAARKEAREPEDQRPADAGPTPAPRIIGGHEVDKDSAPWMVSVQTTKYSSPMHMCGGVIVNEYWVLTAQHCVQGERILQLQVVAGEHQLDHGQLGQQAREVTTKVQHPLYDDFTKQHDVALIRINNTFNWSKFVGPINYLSNPQSYEGEVCEMMGWGPTSDPHMSTGVMASAYMTVLSEGYCTTSYYFMILEGMLCASNEQDGSGPCQGDWGGPLVCRGTELCGIAAWSVSCTSTVMPVVFMNATYYYAWVHDTIQNYTDTHLYKW